ncbi:hypothetical protein D3C78_1500680 [compost metagenome]
MHVVGPGVVDHEQGVVGHGDPVGTSSGDTAGAVAGALDAGGGALAQALQGVVDGDPFEQVAADGVEARHDGRNPIVAGLEVVDEAGGADAPAADLAVDVDLDGALLSFPGRLEAVPVLVGRGLGARPLVEDARLFLWVLHGFCSSWSSGSGAVAVLA